MGLDVPKQFLKIGGAAIIERAVAPFEKADEVDKIIVVAGRAYIETCRQLCRKFKKVTAIAEGGRQRQDSVAAGLEFADDGYVVIHDGARPYVTQDLIRRVLEKAAETGAAVTAVPSKDSVCCLIEDKGRYLDRSSIYQVQTPQAFEAGLLKEAMSKAKADGVCGTDEGSLAERIGAKVAIAEGSYANIKITTMEDLPVETRIGTGFDVHRLTEGRRLVLCGEEIPFEKGLDGHSDADVALHALMDAMLGAAAMGDIGRHFPDSDSEYEGISSIELLKRVTALIREAGFAIGNADVTIMAQRPKLSPFVEAMRRNIAEAVCVDVGNISVKATTTEGLGFTGREEGIAAEAVCILQRG